MAPFGDPGRVIMIVFFLVHASGRAIAATSFLSIILTRGYKSSLHGVICKLVLSIVCLMSLVSYLVFAARLK